MIPRLYVSKMIILGEVGSTQASTQSTQHSCQVMECPPLPMLDPNSGKYECTNSTQNGSVCK